MKNYKNIVKNALILMFFLSVAGISAGQNVSEKLLVSFPDGNVPDAYYIKYDKKNGSYAYSKMDSLNIGSILITSKGNSSEYYGINVNNTFFDNSGNVYCAVYNYSESDSVSTYYLLKNGERILTCEGLTDNWTERNGMLYFKMRENKKEYFSMLDLASGSITKGKAYDTIFYMYWKPGFTEIESDPPPYPGFTPDGKYYYGAILDGKRFVVIDGAEQKAYADIDNYNTAFDKNGTFVYVATDEGSLNDYDNPVRSFVVQGDKEYGKFDNIYGPFVFDRNNIPYYIGVDKISSSLTTQKVMAGGVAVSKAYSGGVSEIQFTPSGKLAFLGQNFGPSSKLETYIVIEGKESKMYENVFNLSFEGETPVFIENKGDKQFIVKGGKKISESFDNISFYKLFDNGELYYAGFDNGANAPDKTDRSYVFIGDKKYGPFETLEGGEDSGEPPVIIDSATGKYAFYAAIQTDKKNNIFKNFVYWDGGKSAAYDQVDNVGLCNGKVVFIGYQYDPSVKCSLNVNGKETGRSYDSVSDFELNAKNNSVNFIGVRDGSAYFVEAKL